MEMLRGEALRKAAEAKGWKISGSYWDRLLERGIPKGSEILPTGRNIRIPRAYKLATPEPGVEDDSFSRCMTTLTPVVCLRYLPPLEGLTVPIRLVLGAVLLGALIPKKD